ncbi:MAG: sulfotransferase domain-containing protein [Gammaproteobacteria bacterium]|nr:sulfotransferase domain-containing protein [Gammaproteobacteria bacterium]
MNQKIKINLGREFEVEASPSISHQLMVCSHERSGTHFTMNSMNHISAYTSDPWLNFDLIPLGGHINFYSPTSVAMFLNKTANVGEGEKPLCNTSIIKSHFPLSLLGEDIEELPLKIIYILRDPSETLLSLWRYFHQWDWQEGPKTETPLELAMHRPTGQSQRYQEASHKDYFARWASHATNGLKTCEKAKNATLITYNDLLSRHSETTLSTCRSLSIDVIAEPQLPSKDQNVISGKNLQLSEIDRVKLQDYCNSRLQDHPLLKKRLQTK